MLKKIVTTVGLVSVFGASTAMAADINISAATFTPLKVSSETVGVANTTTGTGANLGTTFLDITGDDSNLDLDVTMTTGFVGGTTGTNDYFIKVELINAAYAIGAEAMVVTNNNSGSANFQANELIASSVLFSGGTVGSSSAIYTFDISESLTNTAQILASFDQLGTNGDPTIKMSIFQTLTEANKADGVSVSTASKQIVGFAPGNKRTVTPANETAEVSTDFLKYLDTATTQKLLGTFGSVTHGVNASHFNGNDGSATTIADIYTAATTVATINGDLSNGTWWMAVSGCANFAAIPAADKLTLNAAKTSGTTTGTIMNAKGSLCNLIDGTVAMPAGSYTLDINYTPGIASTAGATDVTGLSMGSILRNGTSQNINYLTTFASYNQRVYITNRGTADATYAFTFQAEDGTTATAGTAATGTSKAGTVLALKAADIVTLTGKTRTAASLAIVGTPANFSIATQQVNLSNGATDTVVYKE
jgi:uncharacterized protein YqjF (DUF2071 family)